MVATQDFEATLSVSGTFLYLHALVGIAARRSSGIVLAVLAFITILAFGGASPAALEVGGVCIRRGQSKGGEGEGEAQDDGFDGVHDV